MDVHEGTATVREALQFSAYLCQPYEVPESQKDADVEEILELLELQPLADALVLSLGVEARRRLMIGVELASKPELLLFLDEPTSGLDCQSAWNIIRFLRKLADHGQAILCTIHQPSSLLFESFDQLLLLQRGGETVRALPNYDSAHNSNALPSCRSISVTSELTLPSSASTSPAAARCAQITSTLPNTCLMRSVQASLLQSEIVTGPNCGANPQNSKTPSSRSNGSKPRLPKNRREKIGPLRDL